MPDWTSWPGQGRTLRACLVTVVIAVICPFIGLTIAIGAIADRRMEASRVDRMHDIAGMLAEAIGGEFRRKETMLATLAADFGNDDVDAGFAEHARLMRGLDGDGITLRRPALPGEAPDDWDRVVLPSLAKAATSGRLVISDMFAAPDSLMQVTMLVAPVVRHGRVIATIDTSLSADRLIGVLRRQIAPAGGFALLVDREHRIAAATRDVARLVGQTYVPGTAGDMAPSAEMEMPAGWRIYYQAGPLPGGLAGRARDIAIAGGFILTAFAALVALMVGTHLGYNLQALAHLVRSVAVGSKRADTVLKPFVVAEFEDLRQGMVRAEAVLRRRGAAERIALREARTGHELLISVVNGTAEWIHVKDLELRYVLVNRAGLNLGAGPMAEWQVLGRDAADLFPPEVARRIEAADRRVLATGGTTSFEQEYTSAGSGDAMWLSMTIAPWEDATGRIVGIVSVSRDITKQRRADARMHAIQADLLRATRLSAMGAMASGLAHELNQPLAAATNYLNAGGRLLDLAALGDAQIFSLARGAVADAAQQMLRAGAIVRRLRGFVERGEVELRLESVADVLREACDLARSDGVAEGISLHTDIAADAGAILVDRTQIQQVLLNLIRNAAEAIVSAGEDRMGAVGLTGHVVVSATHAPDGGMFVDVCDNGPGLSPGIAERLFEPFVSSKISGMGIGLAICRTIVEGHGGTLVAQPNASRGMRFRITLPALLSRGDLA